MKYRRNAPIRGAFAAAASGNIGEYDTSALLAVNATALTNNTPKTILSKTFGPGEYLIWGQGNFAPASTATVSTLVIAATSLVDNTNPQPDDAAATQIAGPSNANLNSIRVMTPIRRLLVPNGQTTTVYLVLTAGFTSLMNGYGRLQWIRSPNGG